MFLAIDTATQTASLALHDGERVRVEVTWHSAGRHTRELMPQIVWMIAQAGGRMADVTGVAVSIGPGSFTGLRVGLAVAKGLALANDLPIVGVPTLDVIAHAHVAQRSPLVAVLQAGRGRLAAMRYARSARRARSRCGWRAQGELVVTTADQIGEDWDRPTWLCGELDAAERAAIQTRLGDRVKLIDPAGSLRRAGYLAALGWLRLQAGEMDNLDALQPIYISTAGVAVP